MPAPFMPASSKFRLPILYPLQSGQKTIEIGDMAFEVHDVAIQVTDLPFYIAYLCFDLVQCNLKSVACIIALGAEEHCSCLVVDTTDKLGVDTTSAE